MRSEMDPVERAVELLVLAPLGAGMYVKDAAPGVVSSLVARGRAEVDRHREGVSARMTTVRSTGQFAVSFGVPKLRRRVNGLLNRSAAAPKAKPAPVPGPSPDLAAAATAAAAAASTPLESVPYSPPSYTEPSYARENGVSYDGTETLRNDGLPIPGYDALSASQVVERLPGLGREELDAVQAYESAHRQRRTILGKIEQLAG